MMLSLSFVVASAAFLFSAAPVEASKGVQKKRQANGRRANAQRARRGANAAKSRKTTTEQINEPSIGDQEDGDEREVIDARQRWFMMQRAYPFDAPPAEGRLKAWLARPKDGGRGKDGGIDTRAVAQTWRSIGPSPTTPAFPDNWGVTSGRLNSIAVHPTAPHVILIGAATGGIWRSTDGGANFVPVSDTHVDLAVGSIAFSRSNPSVVYAGMGDLDNGYFGTGVLKSTDAGATWARISNGSLPPLGTTAEIEVDPTNHNRVYVLQATRTMATSYDNLNPDGSLYRNGFYLSEDGGVNWRRTMAGRPRDIAIHPTNPQILYMGMTLVDVSATVQGPAGVYKSLDGGATWLPAPLFTATTTNLSDVRIAVTPAAPERLYVISGSRTSIRVDISDNGGLTWTSKSASGVDPGQFGYNAYIYVAPNDPNSIYVGTRDIYKSTNGGDSWTSLTKNFSGSNFTYSPFNSTTHPDQHAFTFAPNDPNTIYVGNDGGISRSTDGGATFASLNASLTLTQFVGLSMHPTDPSISYGGTQDNGTQRRIVGTNTWREFSSGDGGRSIVNAANPSMVFTTYINGKVNRFTNNGLNFSASIAENATFGEPATGHRIAFYPPMVGNGIDATIYFGTYRLFTCTNCATATSTSNPPLNWTAPGGTTDLTKGAPDVLSAIGVERKAAAQIIYTGSAQGRVMVSTDGGANWTDRTGSLPNRFVESLTVNPSNAAEAYVTYGGYGTPHVFRTTNFGESWTNIGGTPGQPNAIPNVPVSAFLIDPTTPTTLYAGSDIGVFRSTDRGATWATFNNGMLPAVVTGFATSAGGVIQLSTYGRGAFELTGVQSCTYSVTPISTQSFPASGGAGSFSIVTSAGCPWSAISLDSSWITITNGSGMGTGTVTYTVAPNTGAARHAQILHTDDSFYTVTQAVAASPTVLEFASPAFQFGEAVGRANINVTRTGNSSSATTVDYLTVDTDTFTVGCFDRVNNQGGAYARCDFATTVGSLSFAPGETSKTITVPIIDDGHTESVESFQLRLANPTGAVLGATSVATISIQDNDAAGVANPIFSSPFFVRQQYLDFLSREPDQGGFDAWVGLLNNCSDVNNNPSCDRIYVSGEGFFRSQEFQLKGFYVFRFYKVAFNRLPEYAEIVSDMSFVAGQTAQEVYARKAQLATRLTQRPEFQAAYGGLTNAQFVRALLGRYGLTQVRTFGPAQPDTGEKVTLTEAALTGELSANQLTRAQVLRAVADSDEVGAREFNNAFVGMQYYGYLRRKPEPGGYEAWLRVLQSGDVRTMVGGFVNSQEYRSRFGQ
ncbi:MAG TPA: Calx-beta domain-containing protein [Pyrinomonadaceae bacterium]|nr:Calx-beta domain-containing protein [Pyrinomonadaceae bacterium]